MYEYGRFNCLKDYFRKERQIKESSMRDVFKDELYFNDFINEELTRILVWNDSTKNFDGYLKNWVKDSGNSGGIQILVWKDKNTLIIESEESYEAD